jgi:hypothetical protein
MEADLKSIKKLAKQKEDENWEFRSFLKQCDISEKRIDSIVRRLYRETSSKIDCRSCSCANCCKEIPPVLDEEDIKKLSRGLRVSSAQFKNQYLAMHEESGKSVFRSKPCPFLKDNACLHYAYRPKDCISYPHLHKKDFVSRLMGVIQNYSVCPIVFNVYEYLKDEIWHSSNFDNSNDFY